MKKILLASAFAAFALSAHAQSVTNAPGAIPTGAITTGHCVSWASAYSIQDAGAACGSGGGSGITVGTTTITSGTSGRIAYNNAGVYGELATSGSGNVALVTSPVFVTPTLGAATATSINGVTIPSATDTTALLGTAQTFSALNTFSAGVKIASGQVLNWNADTGLSRDSVGVIDVGNGTQGDKSGTVQLTYLNGASNKITLGGAPQATPNAQTLGVQGVVAGTSNTAGALWTFSDSVGTGSANSGGYEFDVHPAGSSGTTQNTTAAAALKIAYNGNLTVNGSGNYYGQGNGPALTVNGTSTLAEFNIISGTHVAFLNVDGAGLYGITYGSRTADAILLSFQGTWL